MAFVYTALFNISIILTCLFLCTVVFQHLKLTSHHYPYNEQIMITGEMTEMGPAEGSEGQTQLKFLVPTRGMIGIRSALLTATKVG